MKKFIIGCVLSSMAITATARTCNPNIQVTRPDSRYEVMTGGTEVKDKVTGLIWQRCTLGQSWDGSTCTGTATTHNWQDALTQASNLGNGYRLPNIKELQSLVETACYDPAINSRQFPNTSVGSYWSASPSGDSKKSIGALHVGFGSGQANDYYDKYDGLYVRGVRTISEE